VALKKLDTGQQLYENQREIDGRVSSHVAGHQRDTKGQMALPGKRVTGIANRKRSALQSGFGIDLSDTSLKC
jgi:hypothetical protein